MRMHRLNSTAPALVAAVFIGITTSRARGVVNDDCANATVVGVGTVAGDTTLATTDGIVNCGQSNTAPDVWYVYTASAAGQLVVTTCGGATWDTVLTLHSGCPGTAANQLACNDDTCSVQSRVVLTVVRNQSVRIRVAGWNGAHGAFQLTIALNPPPTGGADVLIGELNQMQQFGRVADIIGCGVDSPLCNAGGQPLDWFGNPDPRHPFAVSNLYRLQNGRLRQIGMSWVKHGFGAGQSDACGLGCQPYPNGTRLGLGCSDTYDAATNANQAFLGPRYEINPWTGVFGFAGSYLALHTGGFTAIENRLQIHDADLAPGPSPAAMFFTEMYIVAHDDANHMNSVAHEPVQVSGQAGGVWNFNLSGNNTQIGPAIAAWPGATLTTIPQEPATDGRAMLGVTVANNGNGTWHYEYAVYNHDMDRGVQSLTIPINAATTLTNVGFAAVSSHDEPYSNTPWTSTRGGSGITWQTQPYAVNPHANPIRWGTMYNFWFDADAPPMATTATLGVFKPGSPTTLSGTTTGPLIPGDTNGDGHVDVNDLIAVILGWGPCPAPPAPCPADVDHSGTVNVNDLLLVVAHWG